MNINIIELGVAAIVFVCLYLLISNIAFFQPFRNILLIILAAIAAIMILTKVIAPLLGYAL